MLYANLMKPFLSTEKKIETIKLKIILYKCFLKKSVIQSALAS